MRRLRWVRPLRHRPSSEGCGTWVFTCLLSLVFLIFNVAMVRMLYTQLLSPMWPEMLRRPRIEQATHIVVPAALLFVQWWLVELLSEWLGRNGRSHP